MRCVVLSRSDKRLTDIIASFRGANRGTKDLSQHQPSISQPHPNSHLQQQPISTTSELPWSAHNSYLVYPSSKSTVTLETHQT